MSIESIAGIVRTHGREQSGRARDPLRGSATSRSASSTSGRTSSPTRSRPPASARATAWRSSTRTGPSTSRRRSRCRSSTRSTSRSTGGWRRPRSPRSSTTSTAKVLIVGQDFVPHIEKIEDDTPDRVDDRRHRRPRPLGRLRGVPRRPRRRPIPAREGSGSDVAFQLYTSGTTGLPKGVMLTNDNFFKGVMNVTELVAVHARLGEHRRDADVPHRRVRVLDGRPVPRLPHGPAARRRSGAHPRGHPAVRHHQRVLRARRDPVPAAHAGRRRDGLHARCAPSSTARHRSPTRCSARRWRPSAASSSRCTGSPRRPAPSRNSTPSTTIPSANPKLLRSCGKPYPWVEMRIVDPETGAGRARRRGRRALDAITAEHEGLLGQRGRDPRRDRRGRLVQDRRRRLPRRRTASCSCTTA